MLVTLIILIIYNDLTHIYGPVNVWISYCLPEHFSKDGIRNTLYFCLWPLKLSSLCFHRWSYFLFCSNSWGKTEVWVFLVTMQLSTASWLLQAGVKEYWDLIFFKKQRPKAGRVEEELSALISSLPHLSFLSALLPNKTGLKHGPTKSGRLHSLSISAKPSGMKNKAGKGR